MYILFILGILLLLSASGFLLKNTRCLGILNVFGYGAVVCVSFVLFCAVGISTSALSLFNFFYLDALSAFFTLVISIVTFAAALYSIDYISRDIAEMRVSEAKAKMYYALFNLFSASMFLVVTVNNLGMMWVAIEMTTLISAFLVGFYNTKQSVEAAWKYIIICSVGIILALLGTILFSYAFSLTAGIKSLNWTDIVSAAGKLDKNILKIAFIFILVGYGTKAGLAPMHTWLPDAHSQAVAPMSALLSGVLLKTALYAILRYGIIINKSVGYQFFGNLMLLFGLLSLIVSCGFILVQKDLKRLLAYSSIEHIGIISIGLGFGTTLGIFGALLHIFNHAVTKSLMFFGAGNIVSRYKKHNMNTIKGVFGVMPFTATMVLFGAFSLTGLPPFSVFMSEILILIAGFTKGSYLAVGAVLFFIAVIFGAIIHNFGKILFGNIPKEMVMAGESLSGKFAFFFLFCLIFPLGVALPWFLKGGFLSAIIVLFNGG